MVKISGTFEYTIFADADLIDEIFTPIGIDKLSYRREIKDYCDHFSNFAEDNIITNLSDEIANIIQNNLGIITIYRHERVISIVKFRIKDEKSNRGKSGGFRVVGLVDKANDLFVVLSIYRHSEGKDNISEEMKNYYRKVCAAYYESIR